MRRAGTVVALLVVSAMLFAPAATAQVVVVREGLNLTLDLTMTVGAINETVEVRADTPLLESRTAAQGVTSAGICSARCAFRLASRVRIGAFLHGVLPLTLGAGPFSLREVV